MHTTLRRQRLAELLAAIAEYQAATGPDRVRARRNAQHDLREFRTFHTVPERAAFERAVEASKHHRRIAA